MGNTNNVKVKIAGHDYNLRTDDSPEYLEKIAQRADFELRRIMHDNPGFGIQNASVITALMAYDEAEKTNLTVENMRSQMASYVNDAAKSRSAKERFFKKNVELEAENDRLSKENKQLRKRIEELEKQLSPFMGEQLSLADDEEETVRKEAAPAETVTEEEKDVPPEKTGEPEQEQKAAEEPETAEEISLEEDNGYPAAKRRNTKKKKR